MSRRACSLACLFGLLAAPWASSFALESTISPEAAAVIAELEGMVTSRDSEEYEVAFMPLELDRILVRDRLGNEQLYHYLTFRLRNEISESRESVVARASRYNEVLQQMADEYAEAKIANGVSLVVAGEKVLDRADKRSRSRNIDISVLAYDENGSAIDLLDEPIGSGPQKALNIPDYGEYVADSQLDLVRDRIEEQVSRRLLSLAEIRVKDLAPYDPTQTDPETFANVGEVFGVVVFNRLNDHGHRFTMEIRGLSYKLRIRLPEARPGEVENYADTRVLRRVYTLNYSRSGDEFYRDQDRFTLDDSGWRWTDTFQRLHIRADMAYARYFVENITDDKGERQPAVEARFWNYYRKVRADYPDADPKQLPDIEKDQLKQ